MNRTLTLNKSDSKNIEDKAFMNIFARYLSEALAKEGTISEKRTAAYQVFVEHLKELNDYLADVSSSTSSCKRNDKRFYYGQAQKWINMSLKYLWLLGMLPENESVILEAPIDRFIINAVSFENEDVKFPIDKDNPTDSKNKQYRPLCGDTMPWSKLDETEYTYIQEQIKKIPSKESVVEWECNAWISASERIRLGEAIKTARLRKGKTPKDVYDQLGISKQQYSRIEHGYCDIDPYIEELARVLECDFLE